MSTNDDNDSSEACSQPGPAAATRVQKTRKFARRKLKCDGNRPKCMTCQRLGHACGYQEPSSRTEQRSSLPSRPMRATNSGPNQATHSDSSRTLAQEVYTGPPRQGATPARVDESTTAALIPLGLHETLPAKHIIDELNDLYFERVHIFMPMLHKARFLNNCRLPPSIGPPACLRYAIWALTASLSQRYQRLEEAFYLRARRYAEADEMKSFGVSILTVEHVQCWCLLSHYETQKMYFPRAWLSVGRGARLAQMLGLHQVDKQRRVTKQILSPARDWIESEIRRRTFWSAFLIDRWATSGTGWPVIIDSREISTHLPASEQAFMTDAAELTPSLNDVRTRAANHEISTFGATILIADLLGRIREHLHLESPEDAPHDLNGGSFWRRHTELDNDISSLFLSLPTHLKLPAGIRNPDAIFVNMNIHSLAISLHRIAISTAEEHALGAALVLRSRQRCRLAAEEIVDILRAISHLDFSKVNPFTSFSLYLAATTFLQSAKDGEALEQSLANVHFIRSAMQTLKCIHPITGSFLLQLELDIELSRLTHDEPSATTFEHMTGHVVTADAAEEPPAKTTMAEELDRYDVLPISLYGIVPSQKQRARLAQSMPDEAVLPEGIDTVSYGVPAQAVNGQTFQLDTRSTLGLDAGGLAVADYGYIVQDPDCNLEDDAAMMQTGVQGLDWSLGPWGFEDLPPLD